MVTLCWDQIGWSSDISWNFPIILEQPFSTTEDETWADRSEHSYLPWPKLVIWRLWGSSGPRWRAGSCDVETAEGSGTGRMSHRTQNSETPHKWKELQTLREVPAGNTSRLGRILIPQWPPSKRNQALNWRITPHRDQQEQIRKPNTRRLSPQCIK